MKRLLLLLFMGVSAPVLFAQTFNWGDSPQSSGQTHSVQLATNGSNLFFSAIVYYDSLFLNGQTYVSRIASNAPNRPATLLICYQKDGSIRWVKNIWSEANNAWSNNGTRLYHLEADSSGNVYLMGRSRGQTHLGGITVSGGSTCNGSSDREFGLLVKYDSTGAFQWNKLFVAGSGCNQAAPSTFDVAVSDDGQEVYALVTSGDTLISPGFSDYLGGDFVFKYSSQGAFQLASVMVAGGSIWSSPRAEFSNGNLYIGSHWGNTGSGNSHVYKFNPAGGGSFSQKVFTDKVSDLKVAQDTLYLAGNDNMGALYIQKYHYNTDSTLWITRGDSVNNSGSYISIAHDPSGGVIFQAVMSVGAGTHFDHVPIPTDYFKNPLFGKLNRNGRLEWFNQPQRVVVGTPTHMVAVKGMAFCLGQYNWTFFPESDTADFGPFQLWPYNGDNWGHEYLVALDLMDGIQLEINLPDTMTVCSGSSQTLPTLVSGGTGNYSYRWRNGKWTMDDSTAAAPVVMPWQDTTYYVEVSDGFRTAMDSIRIEVPDNYFPLYAFFFPKDSANGVAFVPGFGPLDADSVHWDFGDGTTSNAYWPYHEYAGSGIFEVKLYLENLCGASTFSDTIERCDSAFSPVAENVSNYAVRFQWNNTGGNSYRIWLKMESDSLWQSFFTTDTTRIINNRQPGAYFFYLEDLTTGARSCVGEFEVQCAEGIQYAYNVFQAPEMGRKGRVRVFGTQGGKRLYDIHLVDENGDSTSVVDVRQRNYTDLLAGSYQVFVRDDFGCAADSVGSFVIDAMDTAFIPNLINAPNNPPNGFRPTWNSVDGIINYQLRVLNVTDGSLQLFQTGITDTSFAVTNLPTGKLYRFNVRSRYNNGAANLVSGYSNAVSRNLLLAGNKDVNASSLEEFDVASVQAYPNPTNGLLYVQAPKAAPSPSST